MRFTRAEAAKAIKAQQIIKICVLNLKLFITN